MNDKLTLTMLVWAGIVFTAALPRASANDVPAGLGAGMHAFHGGQYADSFEWLSEVIASGSKDPRAFYFRGLAARRCGRGLEAEADFLEGSRLEAMGNGGWNIGRALERVQGSDRVLLERYRAKARAALATQDRDAAVRRYSGAAPAPDESIFRRRRPEVEGGARAKPAAPKEPARLEAEEPEAEPAATDAFADEPQPAKEAADEPVTPEPAAKAEADEPAAEAPEPGDAKANPFGDDPFGPGEGEPAERKAAEAEGAADATDEQAEREAGEAPAAVDDFK